LEQHERFRLRWAYLSLGLQMQADTYLTITPNQRLSLEALRDKCKGFFAVMDQTFLGPRWSKKDFDTQRTDGFGLVEHVDSNLHVHFALRRPPRAQLFQIRLLVEDILHDFFPAGTVDVQQVYSPLGLTSYNSKEQMKHNYEWHDQVIYLRELAT
jgi:hypothetical protein